MSEIRTIAVLCALPKETAPFIERLSDAEHHDEAGVRVTVGEYAGMRLAVCEGGMGTVSAGAAAQLLITRYQPDVLMFSGIAGGLNRRLGVGDMVVGERLHYLETNTPIIAECDPWLESFTSDPRLVDEACAVLEELGYVRVPSLHEDAEGPDGCENAADGPACAVRPAAGVQEVGVRADGVRAVDAQTAEVPGSSVRGEDGLDAGDGRGQANGSTARRYVRGSIASSNQFNTDPDILERIRTEVHADCEEMEGAAAAHISAKNHVTFLAVRAISNQCGESYESLDEPNKEADLIDTARAAAAVTLGVIDRLAH